MYSGETVDAPVAERTRKVQEWGVLTNWQKGFKRPITFSDLAGKWAPGSRGYASNVDSIASDFYDTHCSRPDPKPELVQEARAGRSAPATQRVSAAKAQPAAERTKGEELARQAIERARAEGDGNRSGLGAKAIVAAKPYGGESAPAPGFTILNEQKQEAAAAAAEAEPAAQAAEQPPAKSSAQFQTASAAGSAKAPPAKSGAAQATTVAAAAAVAKAPVAPAQPPAATASAGKCRVYTASYGGQKAVIIRASADQYTNFTVLDVNEGQEAREIEAYISAYAKGGQKVGDFSSSNAALDTAFQLCPEG
jgi:hypothetical protein